MFKGYPGNDVWLGKKTLGYSFKSCGGRISSFGIRTVLLEQHRATLGLSALKQQVSNNGSPIASVRPCKSHLTPLNAMPNVGAMVSSSGHKRTTKPRNRRSPCDSRVCVAVSTHGWWDSELSGPRSQILNGLKTAVSAFMPKTGCAMRIRRSRNEHCKRQPCAAAAS